MLIQGPKIAPAKAACGLLSTLMANADAMPPFCMPTSIQMVRLVVSSSLQAIAPK